jgi:adenylate cyclase class IV
MGWKNREIEAKLLLASSQTYLELLEKLESFLNLYYPDYETISSKSADYYWDAPKQSKADFIRIRKQDCGKGGIITIKSTDKKDNIDRVEIDLDITSFKQGIALISSLYGQPKAKVTKRYHVLFLENKHTNYSIYQVEKDKRIFLEIEAKKPERLMNLVKKFTDFVPEFKFNLVQSSIFEIFVLQKEPEIKNLDILYERLRNEQ